METPHLIWSLLPLIVFLLVTKFSCIQTTNVTESGSGDDDNQPTGGGEWESDVDFYEFMNDYFALATTIGITITTIKTYGRLFTYIVIDVRPRTIEQGNNFSIERRNYCHRNRPVEVPYRSDL